MKERPRKAGEVQAIKRLERALDNFIAAFLNYMKYPVALGQKAQKTKLANALNAFRKALEKDRKKL